MDAQIAYRLQAEGEAKEQYENFQIVKQVNRDCVNHSAQDPHRLNRQHPSSGQVRSDRYSGHDQAERNLESNQIWR